MTDQSSTHLLVLSAAVVDEILADIEIFQLLANQGAVFAKYSKSDMAVRYTLESPLRTNVTTKLHTHLFMPSRIGEQTTIKCVAVPRPHIDPPLPGLPAAGLTFDTKSGKLQVLLNAAQLTAVRTAAGSLAASVAMQPQRVRNGTLVVFGTGNQARWHACLFVVHHSLKRVHFISTNASSKAAEVRETMRQQFRIDDVQVHAQGSEEMYAALRVADFVCCCTPARSPLFDWYRVETWKPNVHFSLVGSYTPDMQEVPPEVVRRASQNRALAVDSIEACRYEAGDLLKAQVDSSQWYEIGDIMNGTERINASRRLSVFKSVGIALQDTAIFTLIVEEARKRNVGEWVAFH